VKITSKELVENINNAQELIEALDQSVTALSTIGNVARSSAFVIDGFSTELKILYDVIINLMLDTGTYEYEIDTSALKSVSNYQFEMDVIESENVENRKATFKIIFPDKVVDEE